MVIFILKFFIYKKKKRVNEEITNKFTFSTYSRFTL